MALSSDDLNIIHLRRLAKNNKKYIGDDGQTYIGMPNGSLRLVESAKTTTFKFSNEINATNAQDAIESVYNDIEENSQDAVGGILVDSTTIGFTYDDTVPSITAIVNPASIGPVQLENTTVTAGSYTNTDLTVDADGRITAAANGTSSSFITAISDTATIDLTVTGTTLSADVKTGSIGPTELASTAVTAGTYGSATQVGAFTVDADGRLTNAANTTIAVTSSAVTDFTEAAQDAVGAMVDSTLVYVDATPLLTRAALTGDITAPQASNVTTLATVNGNVGTFGSATKTVTLTANGKGLITAISEQTVTPPDAAKSVMPWGFTNTGNLSFADATTYYFGQFRYLSTNPVASGATARFIFPCSGTLIDMTFHLVIGTTPTTETGTWKIVNVTAGTNVTATSTFVTAGGQFQYLANALTFTAGDTGEVTFTTPTYATNPTISTISGILTFRP